MKERFNNQSYKHTLSTVWADYIIWASSQENMSSGFVTMECSNQPVHLQRLARILNFGKKQVQLNLQHKAQ